MWKGLQLNLRRQQRSVLWSEGKVDILRSPVHIRPSARGNPNFGAVAALHASGMKTVKIAHEALRKACATRPSDAMVGKPTNGTATDWVTRGPLNLRAHPSSEAWGLNVQSSQRKQPPLVLGPTVAGPVSLVAWTVKVGKS